MKQLPAPSVLTLPRSAYRTYPVNRWRLFLDCLRHPIIAFAAHRHVVRPELLTDRQKVLISAAVLHGIAAAWLT